VITKLNLSSDPFRNRTLPYVIAAVVLVCSFGIAVIGLAQYRSSMSTNKLVREDVDRMEQELAVLNERGEKVRKSLTPAQEQFMIASHTLVAHKDFSWSRLLSDLETVIPGNVSASRINVDSIYRDGGQLRAELDFSVLAKDYQGVLQMIRNMNEKGIFRASLRGQDLQKSDKFTYSEFTLRLIYTPRSGYAAEPAADVARNEADGGRR
jgi:Tfp pilus assembly protein PilN